MSIERNDNSAGDSYVADRDAIRELVRAHPERARHVLDLPYRLASPAAQDPVNRQIWHDEGQVVAFALAAFPFGTLDYLAPDDEGADSERAILDWGIARWREVAAQGAPPMMFVDVREDDMPRQRLLAERGFARHEWYQLHLSQTPAARMSRVAAPGGFTIRPLAGESEVAAYVALHRAAFGSENMTQHWRQQTLFMPEYHPDMDLVAVAPNGQLAGFCIGWLDTIDGRIEGQVEPMGVHPHFQGHGLGRALLTECLRRLRAAGAEQLHIEVNGDNDAARVLYASVGFRPSVTYLKYSLHV